ncbi:MULTISPECIES: PP2C family serine/threonine-protein phosphatase [unclassified Actinomyces]|uniref:PP2C family protein-serine/threonine phosphatase n=1 Tax=unclassified Actinomyces TaxID=2609248 RepID=UPI000D596431|nr:MULTISPECIES: protein phosphatase 2C domain-containing protein [unclassified Actinomyces]RAX19111.1 serine/threonine-protein phosphatase [Actinomyces sp. Z3]
MTISLRYAARSDVGLVRASNQDSGYAGPHLMLLCDGMGGPAGGDIASAVAVEHLVPLDADSHQAGELLDLLRSAVQEAHADLVSLSADNPDLAGLGTTCIAIMRSGNKLAMVHVGDSRAYLLRGGELTQVTTDHTFVEYLVETGRLTREQARRHPQRSVLLRVLGDAEGDVQLDESIREAVPGDRWLLCSDGLSGPVSADTIGEVLATVDDPGQAGDQLIDLALRAGGPDNVTVVVFDVVENDPQPQTDTQIVGSAANRRARLRQAATGEQPPVSADPPDTTPATTPAAKAAALVAGLDSEPAPSDTTEEEAIAAQARSQLARRRKRRLRSIIATLILVLAVLGAGVLGYQWTQSQYYVTTLNDRVVIYQGIPQEIGPISLSHVVQTYDEPTVDALNSQILATLERTVQQPSLDAARQYVRTTVMDNLVQEPAATPTPVPTATATPTPTATQAPTSASSRGAGSSSTRALGPAAPGQRESST